MTDPAEHEARRAMADPDTLRSNIMLGDHGRAFARDVRVDGDLVLYLLDELAASRAQLEQMRAVVEQAEFGMTLREDVLTPEERIAREAQRNLLALFKDALAAIPDPEAVSRG